MNGYQVTYWNSAGKPAPKPKPGTKILIYKCQKCALVFNTPSQFKTDTYHFQWCPCCQSPDFDYVGIAVVDTCLASAAILNHSSPNIETMIMLDLISDKQLDGGFLGI
ncbi:hypothetical protein KAR91_87010 [Candidatus Pacearchaeota archaeon]|nr:hypothetical protein [Candidatus Pacearchaeota archaeon]